MSKITRFTRASSHATDCNCRNKTQATKVIKQGYHYHKLPKAFSIIYRRHRGLVEKHNINLKKLLPQGISEPVHVYSK